MEQKHPVLSERDRLLALTLLSPEPKSAEFTRGWNFAVRRYKEAVQRGNPPDPVITLAVKTDLEAQLAGAKNAVAEAGSRFQAVQAELARLQQSGVTQEQALADLKADRDRLALELSGKANVGQALQAAHQEIDDLKARLAASEDAVAKLMAEKPVQPRSKKAEATGTTADSSHTPIVDPASPAVPKP